MATMPVTRMVDETPVTAAGLDAESAWWLGVLAETGPRREAGLARLHELLVRVARAEVARRGPRVRITGPEHHRPQPRSRARPTRLAGHRKTGERRRH